MALKYGSQCCSQYCFAAAARNVTPKSSIPMGYQWDIPLEYFKNIPSYGTSQLPRTSHPLGHPIENPHRTSYLGWYGTPPDPIPIPSHGTFGMGYPISFRPRCGSSRNIYNYGKAVNIANDTIHITSQHNTL